ncbi:uncharacterized protein B0H64DRAFT_371719 [Chaetomium fimeti]|uniref:Uncharacterized protein n=1 Tax=Chaetomium fimeti TaxID=1854472 RepID=A0AAE0LVY3_9PEZI|nr:hypothetical protein B0H64DRAFT_371719 [Chaetomium fimeti]
MTESTGHRFGQAQNLHLQHKKFPMIPSGATSTRTNWNSKRRTHDSGTWLPGREDPRDGSDEGQEQSEGNLHKGPASPEAPQPSLPCTASRAGKHHHWLISVQTRRSAPVPSQPVVGACRSLGNELTYLHESGDSFMPADDAAPSLGIPAWAGGNKEEMFLGCTVTPTWADKTAVLAPHKAGLSGKPEPPLPMRETDDGAFAAWVGLSCWLRETKDVNAMLSHSLRRLQPQS